MAGKNDSGWEILEKVICVVAFLFLMWLLCGCVYKGGKVVDGSNIAIGVTIPGTEWTINVLDYVAGVRVAGNDMTSITVKNEVDETNSYFGVVTTSRKTKMSAKIEPCESAAENDLEEAESRER